MRRAAFLLAAVLFAVETSGVVELVHATCVEACADDDASGECAPGCEDCSCCTHVSPLAAPVAAAIEVVDAIALLEWGVQAKPRAPEPRALLHVPRGA